MGPPKRAEANGHQRATPGRIGFSNGDEGKPRFSEAGFDTQQLRFGVGVKSNRVRAGRQRAGRRFSRRVNQLGELNPEGNVAPDDAVVVEEERRISCSNVGGNVQRGS